MSLRKALDATTTKFAGGGLSPFDLQIPRNNDSRAPCHYYLWVPPPPFSMIFPDPAQPRREGVGPLLLKKACAQTLYSRRSAPNHGTGLLTRAVRTFPHDVLRALMAPQSGNGPIMASPLSALVSKR